MSNVLVITTSLRPNSNSDILAERLMAGARNAGHQVEHVSLKGKDIRFCLGCLTCQQTLKCVQQDDAARIAEQMKAADTLVFATPIYCYRMSGQMKVLLDRMSPLCPADYRFRRVYLLSTATEDEAFVPEQAVSGLQGWVNCFKGVVLAGSLFCGGIADPGEAAGKQAELEEAYEFGRSLL